MAKKPVSLTVHKNTIERRRKKELASTLRSEVQKMVRNHDLRAYAIIGIDSGGRSHASWDTGGIMPMWGFPETMCAVLRRDMEESGVEEDWKPPITK